MIELLGADAGDPGRIHAEGMAARYRLEQAREQVAAFLGARSREVVFTSGATESIAAVCAGAAARGGVQVVTAVEHSAVRFAAARHGEVRVVDVDGTGRADADLVLAAVDESVAVVHVQWGNHEVGTTQPIDEVIAGCREQGVLVHVDAAQAAGRAAIDFHALGADLMSISAHKLGGPAGIGALVVRRGLRLDPLLVGGDQERARRAGLENIAAAAGFGAACAAIDVDAESAEQDRLRARVRDVLARIEGITIFGNDEHRLPHLVCAGIADIEPQAVLLGLDRAGIAAHSGSACSSESLEPSPVLQAMGVDAHHSLRLSAGWSTTDDDVEAVAQSLPGVIEELRALRA